MTTQTKFRILVIDDNPSIHEDFKRILVPQERNTEQIASLETALFGDSVEEVEVVPEYEIDSAFQGEDGVNMIAAAEQEGSPYCLAFVDMRMPPGIDGLQCIERFWKTAPRLQVVICTAHSDYSWSETIKRLGWTDRLLILKKPYDKIEVSQLALALSVKFDMERIAELSTQQLNQMVADRTRELEAEIDRRQRVEKLLLAHQSELEVKASIDALTGLQNRGAISDRIEQLAKESLAIGKSMTILFVDIDHFKQVNDTYGHAAGDEILREVAVRLKSALRDSDSIGRYGGEEFVVALNQCIPKEAPVIAERLMRAVTGSPIAFEGQQIDVTISVGLASSELDSIDHNQLMEFADQALYQAKHNGRNRAEQHVFA